MIILFTYGVYIVFGHGLLLRRRFIDIIEQI